MSVETTEVRIPFFECMQDLGAIVGEQVEAYKQKGFEVQSQHYGLRCAVDEGGVIKVTFTKVIEAPDGTPVLLNLSRFEEGAAQLVFLILDFGDFQESIKAQLHELPVGQPLTVEFNPA